MELYDEDEPLELENRTFSQPDIEEIRNIPVAVTDCIFDGCDLSAMVFCGVRSSSFVGCKLRGTRCRKFVRDTTFTNCALSECEFRMAVLDGVAFTESQIEQCDFYGATLTGLTFPGTSFAGVGFDACMLAKVDLSEATRLAIGDPRTLQGASLAEHQVHAIARRLAELTGITIVDGGRDPDATVPNS